MKIGVVGAAADKFVPETERKARELIETILREAENPVLVSGHCPLGGVDIYAEEIADELGIPKDIKAPRTLSWDGDYGFKARNLDIAKESDVLHVICVKDYPPDYRGRRFPLCYHCAKIPGNDPKSHKKGGGCWSGGQALKLGKKVVWHIL